MATSDNVSGMSTFVTALLAVLLTQLCALGQDFAPKIVVGANRTVFTGPLIKPQSNREQRIATEDMLAFHTEKKVAIKNPFAKPLRIISLDYRLKRSDMDVTPVLIADVTPFMNKLVVTLTNTGWGPVKPGELSVCDEAVQLDIPPTSPGVPRSLHLREVGLIPVRRSFGNLTDSSSNARCDRCIYSIPATPGPFSVHGFMGFNPNREKPNTLSLLHSDMTTPRPSAASTWWLLGSNDVTKSSERLTFDITLTNQSPVGVVSANLFLRKLQAYPMSPRDTFLDACVGSCRQGELFNYWEFLYGKLLPPPAAAGPGEPVIGVTVDWERGGKDKLLHFPVGRDVGPGEELTIVTDVLASMSGIFTTIAQLKFEVDAGRTATMELWESGCRVRCPKKIGLDYDDGSQSFVRDLQRLEPKLMDDARGIVQAGLRIENGVPFILQPTCKIDSRQFSQAIWYLWHSKNLSESNIARNGLVQLKDAMSVQGAQNLRNHPVIFNLFDLFVLFFPDAAVEIALSELGTANVNAHSMLAVCATSENCHKALLERRDRVSERLRVMEGDRQHAFTMAIPKLLLCAVCRMPEVDDNMSGTLLNVEKGFMDDLELEIIAWAAGNNRDLDKTIKALRMMLQSDKSRPRVVRSCLRGLLFADSKWAIDDVLEFISRNRERPEHAQTLAVALEYLLTKSRAEWRPEFDSLRFYPYSIKVREIAKQLSGEVKK